MAKGGNTVPSIVNAEHIGPNDTGDNIEAKRVANYIWDGSGWIRSTPSAGGGATEYTDGDAATTHPVGGIPVFNDGGTIRAVSDTHPLPVDATVTATVDTTGLATDANQTSGSQKTQVVDGSGNVIASHSNALDVSVRNASIPVTGTFWQTTQPVSASSLPLPTGAATAANQQTDALTDTQLRATPVPVSGTFYQATQPVSGTVTANLSATDNAVLDDISAHQTDGTQKSQIVDAGGDAVTVTGGKLDVNASIDTTGLATSAKQDTGNSSLASIDGKITAVNTGAVVVSSSALPSGAATSAKQPAFGTAGTSSADVLTVQGRASMTPLLVDGSATTQPVSNAGLTELAAAINSSKLDVNIASSDVATGGTSAADDADFTAGTTPGTPAMGVYESTPTSVTDGDLGTVGITAGRRLKTSTTIDAALPAGTNNIGDVDVLTINGVAPAFGSGARSAATQRVTIATDDVVPVTGTFWQTTQPVSGTVTANAGTNLNTSALALESGGNLAAAATSLAALDNSVDGNYLNTNMNIAGVDVDSNSGNKSAATQRIVIATDQPQLTNALKVDGSAVTQPVSGTFWQATQPVSGTVTANLSATDNAVLDSIDASTASKYITGIGHGVKTVTTAGTDVALATSTACKKVTIQAQTDNTGVIAVGASGVDAAVATGTGILLFPGDSFEFDIDNLADVFIDSSVNGEGVRFTYFT